MSIQPKITIGEHLTTSSLEVDGLTLEHTRWNGGYHKDGLLMSWNEPSSYCMFPDHTRDAHLSPDEVRAIISFLTKALEGWSDK